MPSIAIIICSFGSLIVIQKKRVIRISKNDIFSQKRVFDESVFSVNLFEDIVVSMNKSKLTFALTARLIVKI